MIALEAGILQYSFIGSDLLQGRAVGRGRHQPLGGKKDKTFEHEVTRS